MQLNGVVQRKLALLDESVIRLQSFLCGTTLDQFKRDDMKQAAVERVLQVAVEIVIDIAERIIAIKGAGPAATAVEAIERLVALRVLPAPEPFAEMVRFRNRIVHGYTDINPEMVYTIATTRQEDFRKFRDAIDRL
jgi:uncharacterized protein YutE (UPF0331/DUF86 family)